MAKNCIGLDVGSSSVKAVQVKQSRSQRLGLPCRRRRAAEVIVDRLFPTRMELRDRVSDYYFGRVRSRFLANERRHALIYAF